MFIFGLMAEKNYDEKMLVYYDGQGVYDYYFVKVQEPIDT